MTLLELITAVRSDILDDLGGDLVAGDDWANDDSELLWKNAELTRWANEAETEFARRSPIVDNDTASICQITININQYVYPIDERVLMIRDARIVGQPAAMQKQSVQDMDYLRSKWEQTTGNYPKIYIENWKEKRIRVWPIPLLASTLKISVGRLPLQAMSWANASADAPEIDIHHHDSLLHWIAHRAYQKRDAETYNPQASIEHLTLFTARVGERASANLERERREERNLRRRVRGCYL